jgi:Isy1-like splicing family
MYKHIDADYYGFRDEEDGILLPAEAAAEQALQAEVGLAVTRLACRGSFTSLALPPLCRLQRQPSASHSRSRQGRGTCAPCWRATPVCCMLQAVAEWEAQAAERAEAYAAVTDGLDASATEPVEREFVAYVPLPEQEEIEARVRFSQRYSQPIVLSRQPAIMQAQDSMLLHR